MYKKIILYEKSAWLEDVSPEFLLKDYFVRDLNKILPKVIIPKNYDEINKQLKLADKLNVGLSRIQRLPIYSVEFRVTSSLGIDHIPDSEESRILEKAEANILFFVELLRMGIKNILFYFPEAPANFLSKNTLYISFEAFLEKKPADLLMLIKRCNYCYGLEKGIKINGKDNYYSLGLI